MKQIFVWILILLWLPLTAWTQSSADKSVSSVPHNSPIFRHYTEEDGLAQNSIYCLFQDSKGFLWIGTGHGLSRFDGYQFVNYTRDFQNPNSISDNRVNSVYETRKGELWVGTRNGLNRYDRATDSFKSFKFSSNNPTALSDSYIQIVFEDRHETLWIGTIKRGLAKFDRVSETFTFYDNQIGNHESLSHNDVYGIAEDKNGGFWIATFGGLNQFDRASGRVTRFESSNKNLNTPSDNRILSMLVDNAGRIWLGTENGLNKFEPTFKQFTRYRNDKKNPNSLDNNAVRSIYETKSGTLWIGTSSGLNRYAKDTDAFTVYKHDPANPRSLGEGQVNAILEDTNDQLWVGTPIGGLNKYNQKTARFQQFKHDDNNPNSISNDNIYSILEDRNQNLWLAPSSGGLVRYYQDQKRFEVVEGHLGFVYSFYEDREGRIWIGAETGLLLYDLDTQRFVPYHNHPNDPRFLSVVSIQEDRLGNFLIGTKNGEVTKLAHATGKITNIQYHSNDAPQLANNRLLAIFEDSAGQIWVGSRSALTKVDPATQKFKQYKHDPHNPHSISASAVGAIYEDKSGTLWFGTSSGGLNRFDRQTETFTHFTEREGMPINNVYEILDDDQGHLWLSTDRGLARFQITTRRFRNFDVHDGLTYNEFNDKSAFKNKNGEMYFGGPDGFVKFNPKDFADSHAISPTYLTGIRILEQPLKTEQNVTEITALNLSWRDYVVSFDFATLDFTDPKKLKYQWKLEDFDRDWINGGTRRTATYSNLAGGKYVLKVKATNVDGIWSEATLNLSITVTPPFYRTVWFWGLITLTVGILFWLLYRNRIQQLEAINDAQIRFSRQLIESQEAERKRIASELHDGLGQSLLVIKNRTTIGKRLAHDGAKVTAQLEEISNATGQALEEVRGIAYNLRPYHLERLGLRESLNAMIEKIRAATGLEINARVALYDEVFSKNDEVTFYRVIQECLNNVIKHANASAVEISIVQNETQVTTRIQDNGCGFVAALESQSSGFGLLGLSERVRMLDGTHSVESEAGKGTTVTVIIPLREEKDEH
jgi:signal transduction histidine kinase/ligand-binding sensor domain-containing protein